VKTNANGKIKWENCYGGFIDDCCLAIEQTGDGGYLIAGHSFSDDGDKDCHYGSADYWVVKLNPIGSIVWQKCLGGTLEEYPYDIAETSDGGAVIAGKSNSIDGDVSGNHGGDDIWIVKLKNPLEPERNNDEMDMQTETFKIYSSPGSGVYKYLLPQEVQNARIEIYNMMGQRIQMVDGVTGTDGTIVLSAPVSVYEAVVYEGKELRYSTRFIIQH